MWAQAHMGCNAWASRMACHGLCCSPALALHVKRGWMAADERTHRPGPQQPWCMAQAALPPCGYRQYPEHEPEACIKLFHVGAAIRDVVQQLWHDRGACHRVGPREDTDGAERGTALICCGLPSGRRLLQQLQQLVLPCSSAIGACSFHQRRAGRTLLWELNSGMQRRIKPIDLTAQPARIPAAVILLHQRAG